MNAYRPFSNTRLLRLISSHSHRTQRVCYNGSNLIYANFRPNLFHTFRPLRARPSASKLSIGGRPKPAFIQDERINSFMIQIVNESGSLDPPVRTSDVLDSLDRHEYTLIQVGEGIEGQPPVCKILRKSELRELERTKQKAQSGQKSPTKTIELNWAIDSRDLLHRMKQLATFIEKGKRVEVIMTRKQGKRAPTLEEVNNVMDIVQAAVNEANATHASPMEGQPGKQVTMVLKKKQ